MLKAVIVDDEPYVRQMIKNMIPWDKLSLELVGEFFNGEDAYNRIASSEGGIDVVMTDLRMPVMDGLELIRKSLQIRKGLYFIVVSAYDDFHLVKDAFMLGAKDYLLKSEMTAEQIIHVLSKVPSGGSREAAASDGIAMMKENILSKLVAGNIQTCDMNKLKELLCRSGPKQIVVMILKSVRLDGCAAVSGDSFASEIAVNLTETEGLLEFSTDLQHEILPISPNEYLLLLLYAQQEPASSITGHLKHLHEQLKPQGYLINAGLSRISPDFQDLGQLMHEAKISLDYCFAAGNGSLIRYTPRLDETLPFTIDTMNQMSMLKKMLHSLLFDTAKTDIGKILVAPSTICASHIQAVTDLYMKYHFIITDFAIQNGLYSEIRSLSEQYEKHLKFHGDLNALNKWLTSVISSVKARRGETSVINQVKYYMENHYAEDISLQSAADRFGINSSYLSRLFSEKEDTNFMDYLARIRIAKAIELIQTSNLKIYEVCEKVGYLSPEHFSRTFKKITGKSPKQFTDGRE